MQARWTCLRGSSFLAYAAREAHGPVTERLMADL